MSERRENDRKDILVKKQHEAERRLEQKRRSQVFTDTLKREVINLKNISKDFNRERADRKHDFQIEQLQVKMIIDEQKHSAMVFERGKMKNVRTRTLVESEI